MTVAMMAPVAGRVIQVLRDFLFTQTQALDAAYPEGFTTPQIPTGQFYDYDRRVIPPPYPACSVASLSSEPIEAKVAVAGARVDALHRLHVKFHVNASLSTEARTLEKYLERYVAAALDVLVLMKDGLETAGDPVRWGSPTVTTETSWTESAIYGPEADQADGSQVRTAILPINVRRIENH